MRYDCLCQAICILKVHAKKSQFFCALLIHD
uniref:Uncharacterized protein n=1 Tax=Anguilla anguilla TaxID=7936 RepID=A0A0E9W7J7_ANGAN